MKVHLLSWLQLVMFASEELRAQQGSDSDATLQEVVVTAQKKEESQQKAPVSVTSVFGDDVAAAGIKDFIEIQSRLPNVQFQEATTPVVVIRGVGTYNNQPGVDSAVAYVLDETYLAHHPALMPIFFDIHSVEAVRGPQGTLYGRNSNGGAINIATNKPVLHDYDASMALTVGNYGEVGTEGRLNAPIGSISALRVSFASDKHDPYFDDGYQGANNYAVRVRFLVEPSDALTALFTADYSDKKHQGQGLGYCPPHSAYPACANVPWRPYAGYGGPHDGAHFEIQNYGAYAEINYQTDVGTLTSITNVRKYILRNLWVWDFIQYEPDNDSKFVSQELRFARNTNSASPLDWVVGAFFSHENVNAVEAYNFFGKPSLRFVFADGRSTSKALFGQSTLALVDGLKLTAGLRYTKEDKAMFGSATSFDAAGIATTVPTGGNLHQGRVTWKAGLEYQLARESLIYANASTGFKSGGVNQVPPSSGLTAQYQPEKITAFQVGSKNRFLADRLQVNAEAFRYNYKGYQQYTQESDPTGVFPAVFFITEASQRATFYGGEIESSALIFANGQLDLAMTFLHARFNEFVVGPINNTGNEVQGAPTSTYTIGYSHHLDLPNGARMTGRIGSQHVAGHYNDNTDAPGSYQDPYWKSDINVTYASPSRAWQLTAFARNLENVAVMEAYVGPLSRGGDVGLLMAPRTFGITAQWSLR